MGDLTGDFSAELGLFWISWSWGRSDDEIILGCQFVDCNTRWYQGW